MHRKRPRLTPDVYIGRNRYFLTFCTSQRKPLFRDATTVALVLQHIAVAATLADFDVLAYCFMPDHVHLLVEGCSDCSDARAFVHRAKQTSGFAFSQQTGAALWQPSYFDRVLRHDEATLAVIRYTLENPVRRGLVQSPNEYPFMAVTGFSIEDVFEAESWQP